MSMQASVLVISGDDEQRERLIRVVGELGLAVEAVADARTGLKRAVAARPDVVLFEAWSTDLAGPQFLQRLRRLELRGMRLDPAGVHDWTFEPMGVILLTAVGEPHSWMTGVDAGPVDYLARPYGETELRAVITNQLRRISVQ